MRQELEAADHISLSQEAENNGFLGSVSYLLFVQSLGQSTSFFTLSVCHISEPSQYWSTSVNPLSL